MMKNSNLYKENQLIRLEYGRLVEYDPTDASSFLYMALLKKPSLEELDILAWCWTHGCKFLSEASRKDNFQRKLYHSFYSANSTSPDLIGDTPLFRFINKAREEKGGWTGLENFIEKSNNDYLLDLFNNHIKNTEDEEEENSSDLIDEIEKLNKDD